MYTAYTNEDWCSVTRFLTIRFSTIKKYLECYHIICELA